jgi:hypothetical protein
MLNAQFSMLNVQNINLKTNHILIILYQSGTGLFYNRIIIFSSICIIMKVMCLQFGALFFEMK